MFFLLLMVVMIPVSQPSVEALMEFSRFGSAIGSDISIVDRDGLVFEGMLADATAEALTMQFASGQRVFSKPTIASAERLRDRTRDGFLKGAIFGALLAFSMGSHVYEDRAEAILTTGAMFGAIGWAIDSSQTHRAPIYRAAPALKVSLRF